MTSILKAHKLYKFINGSLPKPVEFLQFGLSTTDLVGDSSYSVATLTPNPDFGDWIAKDHALMTLINATLSPATLAYVVGCDSSRQIWDTLVRHYSSTNRTNVVNLKSDLQSIVKKNGFTIDLYIQRIKEFKDKLANVSVIIDDEDFIIYALNDLLPEFNTFRTSMRTRSQTLSFVELHVLLVSEESALNKQAKRDEICSQSMAFLATNSAPKNQNHNPNVPHGREFGGRGQFSNNNRGKSSMNNNSSGQYRGKSSLPFGIQFNQSTAQPQRVVCQIRFHTAHTAIDCYNRMNYNFQGRHPLAQLAVMVAAHNNTAVGQLSAPHYSWLTDSGCNSHVTSDMSTFISASEYNGDD